MKLHVVYTSYHMALRLAGRYTSRIRGVVVWSLIVLTHLALYALSSYVASLISPIALMLVNAWFLKQSFSIRLLFDIVRKIRDFAERGDWVKTRELTQQIVRRDVFRLDEGHVLSAAIESFAESLVDGLIAPLFYYPFLGVYGALLQRIANTLDSALGYRTPEFIRVGWFSALMDTILNYVPARLCALYIIASSALLRLDWKRALGIWRRDAGRTESKNAGHPMAAMAGALGVTLEKPGHYRLGDGPLPNVRHLDVVLRIGILVVVFHLILVVSLGMLIRLLVS